MLAFIDTLPRTTGPESGPRYTTSGRRTASIGKSTPPGRQPRRRNPGTTGNGTHGTGANRTPLASFLRGDSWEPSAFLAPDEDGDAVATVTELRSPAAEPSSPESDPIGPVAPVRQAGRWSRDHLERYIRAVEAHRRTGSDPVTPESLYFVDGVEDAIREVVGFRMRGHGSALMGAFILPRHHRSVVPNGRPSLASFLSRPPRRIGYAMDPPAPGHITAFMPDLTESIPSFMERLRRDGGSAINVDAAVIDIAFDLRLSNPSEIREHSHAVARPERSVFRTIGGHVVSGVSVGLQQTLHKDDRFIALASAVQHRPSGDIPLPTLAVNRSILALQSPLSHGDLDDAVRSTLAFHPDTASDENLLGECYEGLR
ncbi:MAG: hypothetical protein ACN0LA_13505 [Candidatus Longimicrobiales bacterium M2_2A_002]